MVAPWFSTGSECPANRRWVHKFQGRRMGAARRIKAYTSEFCSRKGCGHEGANKVMDIGILTGPLRDWSLEQIATFAGQNGFGALEVACGPGSKTLDTSNLDAHRADEIRRV